MPSDAERAWEALLRAHARLVPRFDREVQQATALPLTWYDVLLELNSAGGRMTMGRLAERVVLSRTRVSRLVDELARAGMVGREANPADGRSAFAVITEEGRRRFLDAAPVYLDAIEREVGGPLTGDELRTLTTTLEKLGGDLGRST
ncbi:MarR family winged helix-turn-helix transcriptional regulator [Agromyces kandeliae]|uniref:MarR family transcriptional regulator n=1 Tax=Agromyces kandeliae TaxID=2666141 RepID=A0A6L5R301_9MICO|nr:MarR family transcriptional regulator [Agromyces kandeliae]MRX44413.1 MarR family transcriptional regulator [Agromyces kandeliae]